MSLDGNSTDFPRGTTNAAAGLGAIVSLTIPAAPGIAHVLDSFAAVMVATVALAAGFTSQILVSSTSLGTIPLGAAGVLPGAIGETGQDSDTSLNIISAVGEALTVAFNASNAGVFEQLRIAWYDI